MYCSIDFIMDYFIVLGWGGCSGFNGGKSIAVDKWNDIIVCWNGFIVVCWIGYDCSKRIADYKWSYLFFKIRLVNFAIF